MSGVYPSKVGLSISMTTCILIVVVYCKWDRFIASNGTPLAQAPVFLAYRDMESSNDSARDSRARHKPSAGKVEILDNPLLTSLRAEGPVQLPAKDVLKSLSQDSLNKIYHSYLDNTDIICHRKLRMGSIGDGGWEVCDDKQYRPRNPCLVYSFGIANDFSFDDEIARLYRCQVFSFDPSMGARSNQRTSKDRFLQIGIGFKNTVNSKGWKLQTLSQSKKMLNHTGKTVDVLKMDVEFAEWDALPQMIQSGEMTHVRQFLLEYHGSIMQYQHLAILKDIYDLGFRKFYVHKNPRVKRRMKEFPVVRTGCYEVHYVNTKYIESHY